MPTRHGDEVDGWAEWDQLMEAEWDAWGSMIEAECCKDPRYVRLSDISIRLASHGHDTRKIHRALADIRNDVSYTNMKASS